jgi:hypothetical protein
MGFVIDDAGVAPAMRLLFVPLCGLLLVTAVAWVRVARPAHARR